MLLNLMDEVGSFLMKSLFEQTWRIEDVFVVSVIAYFLPKDEYTTWAVNIFMVINVINSNWTLISTSIICKLVLMFGYIKVPSHKFLIFLKGKSSILATNNIGLRNPSWTYCRNVRYFIFIFFYKNTKLHHNKMGVVKTPL